MREHEKLDKSEAADGVRKQRAEQAIETLNKAHDKIAVPEDEGSKDG